MKFYSNKVINPKYFFSDEKPETIAKEITKFLQKYEIPFKISPNTWKFTYEVRKSLNEKTKLVEKVSVQVEILDAGDECRCVRFTKLSGSSRLMKD